MNAVTGIERADSAAADVDVLIVGAGISGIGMAVHLQQQCPGHSFALVDRRANLGGTWDLFRYPGIRSDSDMHTLGFVFEPWKHERSIADGPSILEYLNRIVDERDIRRHIRLDRKVLTADWDSATALWTVTTESADGTREIMRARFFYQGSGYYDYDTPYDAQFAGRETFKGQIIHPQFWPENLDYAGKRVVIIGSGATAVTITPSMTEKGDGKGAAHVTMLQRTPTWYAIRPAKDGLANFLRNPVKEFFRRRLQVSFDGIDRTTQDEESFSSGGLDRWALLEEVLLESRRLVDTPGPSSTATELKDVANIVESQVSRLKRAGRLPMAGPGRLVEVELRQTLLPMVARWQAARDQHPCSRDKLPARLIHPEDADLVFDDWLVGLRSAGETVGASGQTTWIELQASKVADEGGKSGPTVREDKLVAAWVRCLASAACGHPASGIVIGAGAAVHVTPPECAQAITVLATLMHACHDGLSGNSPMPTAVQTGLVFLEDAAKAWLAYDGSDFSPVPGEGKETCLARLYPDFAALSAQPDFESSTRLLYGPYKEWLARHVRVELLADVAQPEAAEND